MNKNPINPGAETGNGFALAIAVGDFTNNADAHIAGNAVVDSGSGLSVNSNALNAFNFANGYLTNLGFPFENGQLQPTFQSSSGVQTLSYGNTVTLASSYPNGGDGGATYQYVGPDNASIDLSQADYSNSLSWTPFDLGGNATLIFFQTLTSYANSDLGIGNDLNSSTSQATAVGQKEVSVGFAFTLMLDGNTSNATIDTGALINQDTSFRRAAATYTTNQPGPVTVAPNQTVLVEPGHTAGGYVGSEYQFTGNASTLFALATTDFTGTNWTEVSQQDVVVEAVGENDTLDLAGNYQSIGYGNFGKPQNVSLAGGPNTKSAVGVTVQIVEKSDHLAASIQDGVSLYADDLMVNAHNFVQTYTFGLSGGKSGNFGLNGVVLYSQVADNTDAWVGAGAMVTVGSAHVILPGTTSSFGIESPPTDTGMSTVVEADDKSLVATVAGGLAEGQKVGIGASFAVNDVNRQTEAYIGNRYDVSSGPTYGSFHSTGPIKIDANNTGYIGTFAIAGAIGTKAPAAHGAPAAAPVEDALSVAVAVADNTVDDGVRAYINGATVLTNGGLTLDAEFTPSIEALSIGGSSATQAQGLNVVLAGAYAGNNIDTVVLTFIDHSDGARSVQATGGDISLTANDGSRVTAQAGFIAVSSTGQEMRTSASSIAGSIGISIAENSIGQNAGHKVEATIDNSVVTATGNVTLMATSTAADDVLAVGGSGSAFTGKTAVDVFAGAGAGAYAANNITETIETHIAADSDVTTTLHSNGSITLTATDKTTLIRADAYGVALAYAMATALMATTESVGVGVGIAQNKVKNTVQAYIDASNALADAGISLSATSSPDIHALGLGIAAALAEGTGLTGSLAGAGSAATNSVNDTIAAYINNSNAINPDPNATASVQAGSGGIALCASDTSNLTADAAAFALALSLAKANEPAGGIAVGASVATNDIGGDGGESIKAYIDNSSVTAAGVVTITATLTATIHTLAIGGSLAATRGQGFTLGLAGAGAGVYSTVEETIEASIKGGSSVTTTNSGSVDLTATDSSSIDADAGGVAIAIAEGKGGGASVSGSIGAAVASNTETNTVSAFIDSSNVVAAGSVSVTAKSGLPPGSTAPYRIDALALGIAISGSGSSNGSLNLALAGAGSGAYNTVDDTIAAYIKDCSAPYSVHANGGMLCLTASDDTSIRADSGGYAVAIGASTGNGGGQGAGAIGASESNNTIGGGAGESVKAYIENSTVTAASDVTIKATSTVTIDASAIGGSGAGSGTSGTGVSGAVAGAALGRSTRSRRRSTPPSKAAARSRPRIPATSA